VEKTDFKKTLKQLYDAQTNDFIVVEVPSMIFVKVDGHGDPNTSEQYKSAVEWLYGVSYAMKFAAKKLLERDYVVPPLEALWWSANRDSFVRRSKDEWNWTTMIMVPDFVTHPMFTAAVEKTTAKLGQEPATLRLEIYDEGRSLQILHVGSYDDEAPKLARLHDKVMPGMGVTFNGAHHEIYLSDPRKTVASKLKTILRQPIKSLETTS